MLQLMFPRRFREKGWPESYPRSKGFRKCLIGGCVGGEFVFVPEAAVWAEQDTEFLLFMSVTSVNARRLVERYLSCSLAPNNSLNIQIAHMIVRYSPVREVIEIGGSCHAKPR
jgi:hypothetical protein